MRKLYDTFIYTKREFRTVELFGEIQKRLNLHMGNLALHKRCLEEFRYESVFQVKTSGFEGLENTLGRPEFHNKDGDTKVL